MTDEDERAVEVLRRIDGISYAWNRANVGLSFMPTPLAEMVAVLEAYRAEAVAEERARCSAVFGVILDAVDEAEARRDGGKL
jgi:hypothetical protein